MFPYASWKSEIWKTAARAGLRQIGRMVQQGNLAGASSLAKAPGVLKPSAAGSQIRHLGAGSEGLATLVAHPEHGVAVRKLYDPQGLATPEMIQRKEVAGRAVGANPNVAQFYGSAQTPQGGTMHFSEFVSPQGPHAQPGVARPGMGPLAPAQAQAQAARSAAVERARQGTVKAVAGSGQGFSGAMDVRDANMVWDGQSGRFKTIDYMPTRRGEFYQPGKGQPNTYRDPATGHSFDASGMTKMYGRDPRSNVIPTSRGQGILNSTPQSVDPGTLTRSMLGKAPAGSSLVAAPSHESTAVLAPTPRALGSNQMAVGSGQGRQPPVAAQPTTAFKKPMASTEATAFLGKR